MRTHLDEPVDTSLETSTPVPVKAANFVPQTHAYRTGWLRMPYSGGAPGMFTLFLANSGDEPSLAVVGTADQIADIISNVAITAPRTWEPDWDDLPSLLRAARGLRFASWTRTSADFSLNLTIDFVLATRSWVMRWYGTTPFERSRREMSLTEVLTELAELDRMYPELREFTKPARRVFLKQLDVRGW